MSTPPIVVFLINDVAGVYPEIQSWEISWIIWGCIVFLIGIMEQIYVHYSDKHYEDATKVYGQLLVAPFGLKIDAEYITDVYMYICPLVALAPAIVGGYMANFFLEIRYFLDCDAGYNDISAICIDEICCVAVNSHEDWVEFLPKVASSSVAAWGVVKIFGTFLLSYDDNVEVKDRPMAGQTTGQATTEMAESEDAWKGLFLSDYHF